MHMQEDRAQSCKAASTRGAQGGEKGNDWLGTWAKRQVHYKQPPPPSLPAHIPGTPQPSDRTVRRRAPGREGGCSGDSAKRKNSGEGATRTDSDACNGADDGAGTAARPILAAWQVDPATVVIFTRYFLPRGKFRQQTSCR